MKIRPWYLWHL